jgi:Site-specific recombinases, DNA invertase Pin homologs
MIAVGYARLSDKDSSSNSIKSQMRRIEEYCERNKLTLLKIFVDDGKSGWTFDRPGFIDLENFCKKEKSVQYLIIPHFDRFSRTDPIDAMVKERYFRDKLNVKVLQVSEPIDLDTNNPTYVIVRFMQAFASNEERNRIVDRTMTGMRYSLTQGRYCSMAPYGYKNSRDENGKPLIIPDEERAHLIKFIFREYLRGNGIEEVKRMAKVNGYTQGGKSAIARVLTNPVYAGMINVPAYKHTPARLVKGIHAPLISENDYWMTQEKITGKNHRTHNRDEVPLRGVLRCHCGRYMTAAPSKGKSGKHYWYYFCESHRKINLSANRLHAQFEDILDHLSIPENDLIILRDSAIQELNNYISDRTGELMRIGIQIEHIQKAIEAIEEKYLLQADITPAIFNKLVKVKRIELSELQAKQAALKTDTVEHYNRLYFLFSKLSDLKSQWLSLDLTAKQFFIKQVFGLNLTYRDGVYRTPFIHPLFALKGLSDRGLPLVIETKTATEVAVNLECAPGGNLLEHLLSLANVFAA